MKLGISADGRVLTYDENRYAFQLSKQPVSFDDVRALDGRDWIRWRAPELRDWFAKINRDAFIACHNAARLAIPEAGATQDMQDGAGDQVVDSDGASRPQLRYRSTNPDIATVDDRGRVIVHVEGEADILVAHMQDSEFASAVRLITIVSELSPGAPVAEPPIGPAAEEPLPEAVEVERSSTSMIETKHAPEEPAVEQPSPSRPEAASASQPSTEPAVRPSAKSEPKPAAKPASKSAPRTREIQARLRAENGVLAVSKRFLLPELPSAMVVYEKVGGCAHIAVSPVGEVTIGAGMPCGRHSAEIVVNDLLDTVSADASTVTRVDAGSSAPAGNPASVPSLIIISIEVEV